MTQNNLVTPEIKAWKHDLYFDEAVMVGEVAGLLYAAKTAVSSAASIVRGEGGIIKLGVSLGAGWLLAGGIDGQIDRVGHDAANINNLKAGLPPISLETYKSITPADLPPALTR